MQSPIPYAAHPVCPDRTDLIRWSIAFAAAMLVLSLFDHGISVRAFALGRPFHSEFNWMTRWGESDWILIPSIVFVIACRLALMGHLRPRWRLVVARVLHDTWFIFVAVGLSGLAANLMKRAVGRSRPDVYEQFGTLAFHPFAGNYHFEGFPSGHAATAVAFGLAVSFLMPRLWPLGVAYAIAIIASRLALGAHYPTDLLAGAVLGIAGAYGTRDYFARRRRCFVLTDDRRLMRRCSDGAWRSLIVGARRIGARRGVPGTA